MSNFKILVYSILCAWVFFFIIVLYTIITNIDKNIRKDTLKREIIILIYL